MSTPDADPLEDLTSGMPRPGDILANKYRIERIIGRGAMGVVYAAHHEVLRQRVALKLLLPDVADNAEAVRASSTRPARPPASGASTSPP